MGDRHPFRCLGYRWGHWGWWRWGWWTLFPSLSQIVQLVATWSYEDNPGHISDGASSMTHVCGPNAPLSPSPDFPSYSHRFSRGRCDRISLSLPLSGESVLVWWTWRHERTWRLTMIGCDGWRKEEWRLERVWTHWKSIKHVFGCGSLK